MTELQDLSQATADPADLGCDVCIIGSGCGGATAARVLAEAGKDVILLEEGGDFTGSQLTQRDAAMYDQLYAERGGRTTEDGTISVLSGRVLGGGGVIKGPYDDAHERRAVVYDNKGNGLVFYSPLKR